MNVALVALGFVFLFLATSLRVVPNNPPHIALVTLFGRRTRWVRGDGLQIFPFAPWIYNGILIDVSTKMVSISSEVPTRDMASLSVVGSITWTPMKQHAIEYLNNGGKEEVEQKLKGMALDSIRNWAIRHPGDWRENLMTGKETYLVISQMMVDLPKGLSGKIADEHMQTFAAGGTIDIPNMGIMINRINIESIKPMGMSGAVVSASEHAEKRKIERGVEAEDVETMSHLVKKVASLLAISISEAHVMVQGERDVMSLKKKFLEIKPDIDSDDLTSVLRLFDRVHSYT